MRIRSLFAAALLATVGALSLLATAPAQAADPVVTKITVDQTPDQQPGKPVTASAKLTDASGKTVSGVLLKFYVVTDAFGPLPMKMAEATTDASGTATVSFKPTWVGDIKAQVYFTGNANYAASLADFQFKAVGPVKIHQNAKFGLQTVRDWAPFVVAALVAVIWATFIVVFLRVVLAMRGGSGEPATAKH
jgi:hypothetical protein